MPLKEGTRDVQELIYNGKSVSHVYDGTKLAFERPTGIVEYNTSGNFNYAWPWAGATSARVTLVGGAGGGGQGGAGRSNGRNGGAGGSSSVTVNGVTQSASGGFGGGGGRGGTTGTQGADGTPSGTGGGAGGLGADAQGAIGGDGGNGNAGQTRTFIVSALMPGTTLSIVVGGSGGGGGFGIVQALYSGKPGSPGSVRIEPIWS